MPPATLTTGQSAVPTSQINFAALEDLVRRDPGGRGVASFRDASGRLGEGQLEAAARDLTANARSVAIVTGFCVNDGQRWVAETDGPPGALALADALQQSGAEVVLISDAIGIPALMCGAAALGLQVPIEEFSRQAPDRWTHLLAIERVGPSHTLESVAETSRDEFARLVPPEHRNVCHNMRGSAIDEQTAPTHLLWEAIHERQLPIRTIGIADGGNELGMGQFAWETLCQAIAQGPAAQVACRIACDWTIVAGVSNWGGYALAAAVDCMTGENRFWSAWNESQEQQLLTALVREGCIDGLTRRREATVDGLSPVQLAEFWHGLRAVLE